MKEKVQRSGLGIRPELVLLIVAATLTRMWALFSPNSVVFDEVYFKVFAAHYLDGKYYFDIHPPLGKLLLAGWAHLIGLQPNAMINGTALGMRILPATAGLLLIPLMWGILRRLGASRPFAFLGSAMVLFDNAILVESRFILMDSMLLLFGLSAVYFYLIAQSKRNNWRWLWICISAITAGAALSVKWTGLNALAIILLVWLWDQRSLKFSWLRRFGELCALTIIPAILYISVFWIHFSLLPYSGDGDAFMSPQFQSTLIGNPYYNPAAHISFWNKFVQLNIEMYHASETLTATHPYGSKWYSWPLELRPIYYWEGSELSNGYQGNIYLLGNPVVWWGIWTALLGGLGFALIKKRALRPTTMAALAIAGVAYLINYLPFIGITRVMFLYHYFFAFLYSIIFVIMLWNDLATDRHGHQFKPLANRQIYAAILLLIIVGFCFFAPISYGSPLSPAGLQDRMWLHTWR
jgi:dolichyl-phosphate-mannose-protein mannosyltransferase